MPVRTSSILGPAHIQVLRVMDDFLKLEPAVALAGSEKLAEELVVRARDTPFAVLANIVAEGTGRDARTMGLSMLDEAVKVGQADLADMGYCWLLVASLRGDSVASRKVQKLIDGTTPSITDFNRILTGGPDRLRAAAAAAGLAVDEAGKTVPQEPSEDEEFLEPLDGPTEQPPGRTVLRAIGDPRSKDGVELAKRFKDVIDVRLSYAGRLPARGETKAMLLEKWPWAIGAANFLENQSALMRQSGSEFVRIPPLLFVGEPGSGKTSIAQGVAQIFGLSSVTVACSGVADSGGLAATGRGWATARPSAPFLAMADSLTANPAMVLDEIDKGTASGSQNGSVWGSALGMLDRQSSFQDSCLMAEVDLSAMSFMATANDAQLLPTALRDRFLIVRVPRPRAEDFDVVLREALKAEAASLGTDVCWLPQIEADERLLLRKMFSKKEHSLRSFRKMISMMLGDKAAASENSPRVLH